LFVAGRFRGPDLVTGYPTERPSTSSPCAGRRSRPRSKPACTSWRTALMGGRAARSALRHRRALP